jgi:hypothetical protein
VLFFYARGCPMCAELLPFFDKVSEGPLAYM